MVRRITLLLVMVLAARGAAAGGWSPPEWKARIEAGGRSDMFPGSAVTGPDQGLEAEATAGSSVRLASSLKLGLEARAGGILWRRFGSASSGWLGGSLGLRSGGTQFVAQGEWTPHRLKFADDAGDAAFRRAEWRLGVRSALTANLRLRVEGRLTRDDYAAAFDARDAHARSAFAQLALRAGERLTLRADRTLERTATTSFKYANREPATGGSATWEGPRWRFDAGARSGIRRYTEARPTDSNFRRRDQWLELTGAVARRIRPGASITLGGTLLDQTSSRVDRNYTVQSIRLAFELGSPGR